MSSTLTWIDHDPKERDRMNQILSLFSESETRDELGIGPIRDSFADLLFPGTSTIQTRLRYMLFIPWIYKSLEEKQVPSAEIARRARNMELSLIVPLEEAGDHDGIIGKEAREKLKRLPSSVYWSGLWAWGLKRFPDSQDRYHQGLDSLYQRRRIQRRTQDDEVRHQPLNTWHLKLPPIPIDFPEKASFKLTRDEAEFIKEQIVHSYPQSFLRFLVNRVVSADVPFPWEHSQARSFKKEHQLILHHAQMFSEVMYGANILYNLILVEMERERFDTGYYLQMMQKWRESLDIRHLREWSLSELWTVLAGQGHTISNQLKSFVLNWVNLVKADSGSLARNRSARKLIELREWKLKGNRSRLRNQRMRDQFTGRAGLNRLDYRWHRAKVFLQDLCKGLKRQ